MINGKTIHKCKRCGNILKGVFIKDIGGALRADFNRINRKIPMYKVHYCEDGGVGIAELIGADPDKHPQKEKFEKESEEQQVTGNDE